jgi:hypothetical protein
MGRYIDGPDSSGNKLSLQEFHVNDVDWAIKSMKEFNQHIGLTEI